MANWDHRKGPGPQGNHLPPVKPRKLDPPNHPQAKPSFSKGDFEPKTGPSPNLGEGLLGEG